MIFVVGPSRSGKTTLLNAVLRGFPRLRLLDLDAEERRSVKLISAAGGDPGGREGRWSRNMECLRSAEVGSSRSGGHDVVVDVGAGSLQTEEGRRFFAERGRFVIAILAPWEVIHRRHPGRDAEEFRRTEFSNERESVYQAARFRVDSSSDIGKSVMKFRAALQELLHVTPDNKAMNSPPQFSAPL